MKVLPLATAAWKFRDCSGGRWLPARVPGCVHTDLRRAGRIPDPRAGLNEALLQWIDERDWGYEAAFTAGPALLEREVVELVADGLDTIAEVRLNGSLVARTENMFIGHRWNVKRILKPGRNVISIRFSSATRYIRTHRRQHAPRDINDPVGRCTVIRKEQCQFGWDWGPRYVTAGIWRDIRIEAWDGNRLQGIAVTQRHAGDGTVTLTLRPELARAGRADLRWRITSGKQVREGKGRRIVLGNPRLWWPNGQGEPHLHRLEVDVAGVDGRVFGRWDRRIGLRTIELDRHKDPWGESFQFKVNGRPIFAKGANWIPASTFVAELRRADYARDIASAAAANMNMLRVWGGGIYESEDFYDLCDEQGILVWQDFMFACTLYPGDAAFIRSSREEADHQLRRLRHRACLALWCGNNEIWGINAHELVDPGKRSLRRDYERLFHKSLPAAVARHDPATPYWPSSPWRGSDDAGHAAGEKSGDSHFWDVWHGRNPVKDYEKWNFRFASEFGMQSYNSAATQDRFCPPGQRNIFGPAMENHQKNKGGNQVILDYVSRRYRFPRDQDSLIYLSQLNQAHCIQTGVAHYRRIMPRCMGALYWQLNDCWPVASWSSIEFTGRWRALHHAARRFFAPAFVSAHVPGDEVFGINNYRRSTVGKVHIHTTFDSPSRGRGVVRWDLFHLDGRRILRGIKKVSLLPMTSVRQTTLDLGPAIARHGRENVYLRVALDVGRRRVSQDTAFLTLPRFMDLPRPRTRTSIRVTGPGKATVSFTSPVFQHMFAFDFAGMEFSGSDNFFDLYPGERREVEVSLKGRPTAAALRRALSHRSLADSY